MWVGLFPGMVEEQVPIGHITNGVHVNTWLAPQMRQVYDRHMGPDWPQRASEPGLSSSWTVNQTSIARHLLPSMVAMRRLSP